MMNGGRSRWDKAIKLLLMLGMALLTQSKVLPTSLPRPESLRSGSFPVGYSLLPLLMISILPIPSLKALIPSLTVLDVGFGEGGMVALVMKGLVLIR